MKSFDREPNQLRCYICVRKHDPGTNLRVGNDIVKRKRTRRGGNPKLYDQVSIDCKDCGHQWYSMHPEALARARKQDADLARRHGGQK